jgi:hypothetical protein
LSTNGRKCPHHRQRSRCKECGGGSICEHNKRRSECKECGGGSICEHKKQRSRCKECGGGSICEHKKRRSECKECGGGSICEHKKLRSECTQCGGGSICEHKKKRSRCTQCGGGSICEHNKRRADCSDCLSVDQVVADRRFCACGTMLSMHRLRANVTQCAACDPAVVDRTELVVRNMLLPLISHPPSALDDVQFGRDCDTDRVYRRPDALWLGDDRAVHVEIDERGGHSDQNYTPECEMGFVADIHASLIKLYADNGYNDNRVPYLIVLRFNPDECDRLRASLEERVAALAVRVNYYLTVSSETLASAYRPLIEYMYYHSKCADHIAHARAHPEAVCVVREI